MISICQSHLVWIYLDKRCWNKGYGKEAVLLLLEFAFKSLNLNKVYLDVGAFNQKAVNIYKSLGFEKDGILRQDVYMNGQYIDVIRMSAIESEVLRK